jgi:co-chaperonin GroES (HSP10)
MDKQNFKAIGKWVFVKRDAKETDVSGVGVSEKAQVKNYVGEVHDQGKKELVKIGDRVHIPHYGVQDAVIDGEEYAVFDADKLFAKQIGKKWIPINEYVMVRKCVNDHIRDSSGEVALYMTDKGIENTNWVEIIDVSEDCKHMRKDWIGYYCVSPESDDRLCRILTTKDFCLHESLIKFITDGE